MILSYDFMRKVARALGEEETDVYTLSLYSMSSDDMSYFNETDKEKIVRIFKVLVEDTKRHAELLKLIIEMGAK